MCGLGRSEAAKALLSWEGEGNHTPARTCADVRLVSRRETDSTRRHLEQMDWSHVVRVTGTRPHGPRDGHAIHGRKVFRSVRRLHMRIAEAMRHGRRGKVHALRRILTRSLSAADWAVRRVTEHQGKQTPGVDGIIWTTPEAKQKAARSIQAGRHTPLPLRRVYIPKANGKRRPLGMPAVEDKLLQVAVARLLTAIDAQEFLRCSDGYRPNVGALDAVDTRTIKWQFGRYHWVVEADSKGFFDTIDHEWLLRMVAERVDDQALLRLIRTWLKAGVLETDGQVVHPATGTPQAGTASPILANVYGRLFGREGTVALMLP